MKKAVIFDFYGVLVINDSINSELVSVIEEIKKNGWPVFVLSNADTALAAQHSTEYPEVLQLFDKLYYSGDTGFLKPDLAAYKLILEENNLQPAEVFYFDDSAGHVASAQSLGINSYLFKDARMVRDTLHL